MEDRRLRGSRRRDGLDQRMDQWLETGRQLVDGVSGRRPGQRRTSLDLDSVGRWVGEKVEWLLEDDEDWREPWQEQAAPAVRPAVAEGRPVRRPLDAISRRSQTPDGTVEVAAADSNADEGWPDDDNFRVERWSRGSDQGSRRSLPRSSRRRT